MLTGLSRQREFRRLLVAPHSLRSRILGLIEREIEFARAGKEARIVLKLNAIVDPDSIEAIYRASQAGVDVDLIVRGICSVRPGVPGLSERIRVRSIVGEFLEHSRIFGFANGGQQEWYIGSADLMERNLDRRVEAVVPVEDPEARVRIAEIVELMLADDRRSWQLGTDAVWRRTEELTGIEGTIDTFAVKKAIDPRGGARAAAARRPGSRDRVAGSARMTVERPVEIELKYAVADRTIGERLLNAETLAGFRAIGAPRPTQHEDRYVDSADGALARAGFAARLRTSANDTIVSVKSTGGGDGSLHQREELEGPADRTSDVAGWPPSAARSLILELCGDAPLVELVTIRQFRRRRDLELPAGRRAVELSLDEVDVVARGRVVERFLELELELSGGRWPASRHSRRCSTGTTA